MRLPIILGILILINLITFYVIYRVHKKDKDIDDLLGDSENNFSLEEINNGSL